MPWGFSMHAGLKIHNLLHTLTPTSFLYGDHTLIPLKTGSVFSYLNWPELAHVWAIKVLNYLIALSAKLSSHLRFASHYSVRLFLFVLFINNLALVIDYLIWFPFFILIEY